MAGKRKRETVVVRRIANEPVNEADVPSSDLFRKYFEATYEPLPESTKTTKAFQSEDVESGSDDSSDDSPEEASWDGLSDDALSSAVHVVDHGSELALDGDPGRGTEFKSFMVPLPVTSKLTTVADKT